MNLKRLGALGCLIAAIAAPHASATVAQSQSAGAAANPSQSKPDKAQAYYHYSLGHIYEERGAAFNRPELLARAIDEFKLALQNDPDSSTLSLELADLYATTGRWQNALQEAEDRVKRHPEDMAARKLLGRLYVRLLMPGRGEKPAPDLQEHAVQQFEDILQRDPKDISSYLTLSQLYRLSGDNAKAEAILKKAIAMEPDSSEANSNLAMLYADMGDYKSAIDLLKGVAKDKADPQVWGTLAYAYEQVQDYKNAASAYAHAIEGDPDNAVYRRGLGQSLMFTKQYDQALEQFEGLIEGNPRDVESYLRASQIYRIQHKYDQAQQNLTKALELAPDNPEILLNQVMLLEAQNKAPEAIAMVQKILDATAKQEPSPYGPQERAARGVFLEKLGSLYRGQGDFANAESAFRSMLTLGKENAVRGELNLLQTYEENKQYDKALDESDRAVKQYPESRELVAQRASLLASTGRGAAAIALLKPLLKNTSDDREIWLSMARVYQEQKQFDQARDAIAKADDLSESESDKQYIHFMYGSVWERQKNFQRAEQEFKKVLQTDPDSAMTLNYLGYMWADQGVNLDEAVKYIKRALDMEPDNAAYMDSLGWAYYKQNKLDLAQQYLEGAVKHMGTDPTILDHLAEVYYSSGRIREAETKWRAALDEWGRLPKPAVDQDEVNKIQKKLKDALKIAQDEKPARP